MSQRGEQGEETTWPPSAAEKIIISDMVQPMLFIYVKFNYCIEREKDPKPLEEFYANYMTEFIQRHIGITETEQTQMLKDLGLSSLDELVRQVVPDSILLRGDNNLPESCTEQQALEEL